MKEYTFYTDINLYGRDDRPFYEECGNLYLLGNIVDLRFCKKELYREANEKQNTLLSKYGNKYLTGDRSLLDCNLYTKEENILFTYGDTIFQDRVVDRNDNFIPVRRLMYNLHKVKLNCYALEYLSIFAFRHSCNTIITGYFNPSSIIDEEYNGVRIIILPAGRTTLTL